MKKSIRDFHLAHKKVIIRSDLNVPLQNGKIVDDTRIKKSVETIQYAINQQAKVIVLSHLGRIKEEADKKKNDLKPVAKRLSELLEKKVIFIPFTRGKEVEQAIANLKEGQVLLLQNTRFEDLDGKKESQCDMELAKYWASLGDIFINDAFGTLHRKHASNVGIASYLPSGIGFLVEKEITALDTVKKPKRPFVIVLGGGKVHDKIPLIKNLLPKCDQLLIGGGMAFTFLQAEGYEVGNSLVDVDSLSFCQEIVKKYATKIILPIDIHCNTAMEDQPGKMKDINELEFNDIGLDIGQKTIQLFKKYLTSAKMVVWNGPLGVYELSNYAKGTEEILKYLAEKQIKTIVAGGDIVAVATRLKIEDQLYHVSTGGGATLKYLEGTSMPGLEKIEEE